MSADFEMKAEDFTTLQSLPGNTKCIDCGADGPDWGSPKLGILFCFKCSGLHRGLGTHISFVRSVTMDAWTDKQVQLMKAGGNQQCKDFLQRYLDFDNCSLPERYDTPAAELYQQVLVARIEGRPEPTELPERKSTAAATVKREMKGFGSPPPPTQKERVNSVLLWVAVPIVVAFVAYFFAFR